MQLQGRSNVFWLTAELITGFVIGLVFVVCWSSAYPKTEIWQLFLAGTLGSLTGIGGVCAYRGAAERDAGNG